MRLPIIALAFLFFSGVSNASTLDGLELKPFDEIKIVNPIQVSAEVVSLNQTQMISELNAQIKTLHVRPGDQVEAGQLLAELDCRDTKDTVSLLDARQRELNASLEQAERLFQRFTQLESRQFSDRLSREDAQTNVVRARAQLSALAVEREMAQRQVSRCQVVAPFSAAVVAQRAGEGQWVSVGSPIFELTQTSPAEISVQLPQARIGTSLDTFLAIFKVNGREYPVSFLRQSPVADPATRSVHAWFQAPEHVAIGETGQLYLDDQIAYLPAQTMVMREGQMGVFILEGEDPIFYPLPGAQEGRPFPAPLSIQSKVLVTSGQHRLSAVGRTQ